MDNKTVRLQEAVRLALKGFLMTAGHEVVGVPTALEFDLTELGTPPSVLQLGYMVDFLLVESDV